MKTKFIFLGIILVFALIAFKTYRDTTALKSIDSYESCVASKGSKIQESYPATCTTRLGSHFIEKTIVTSINQNTGWTIYHNTIDGYTLEYPEGWYYNKKYGIYHRAEAEVQDLINAGLIREASEGTFFRTFTYIDSNFDEWLHVNYLNTDFIDKVYSESERKIGVNSLKTLKICNGNEYFGKGILVPAGTNCTGISIIDSSKGGFMLLYPDSDQNKGSIEEEQIYEEILSTFKFIN